MNLPTEYRTDSPPSPSIRMSYLGEIGDIVETGRGDGIYSCEWRIPDFPSLAGENGDSYQSPAFDACDGKWCFDIFPNGLWRDSPSEDVSLILYSGDACQPKAFNVTLGIRGPEGVENKKGRIQEFSKDELGCDLECFWSGFCQRSDLTEQNSRLMPGNMLTLTLDMKSVVPSVARDKELFKKEVESFMEQIKTLQKTVENYELESENYKKQISALESEKVSIAEEYKGLLEEKLTVVSGLQKDNDLHKKGVESFKEQIETLQKTVENYELESQNYKKEISTLESEKVSIAEEYKGLLEEKLTVVSGLEKDNDLLKKVVQSFMEQIKTLQQRVENFELESQNYKKQISTLESEKLSTAEEYKGLLEEKLTVVSGLEKEICDSKVRIDELQEINQTLVTEKTKLDEEKSQFEIELKKLKESAPFRNEDNVENDDKTSGYERVHLKDENSQSRSNALYCDFSDLYADEVSPNFVLKCNGWSIPVNTFVLSVRSDFFRNMFRSILQENETGSTDIKDLEVPVLMSMLKFLYCGKLEDVSEDNIADLYKAGDMYACSLKVACCQWMERNLTQENCITFLKVADSHSDQDLRAAVVSFTIGHPGVMKTTAWLTYSNEHPKLANNVLQAYISSIIP